MILLLFHVGLVIMTHFFIERNVRAPKMKEPPKVLNVRNFKRFDNDSFRDDVQKIPMNQIRSFSGDVDTM